MDFESELKVYPNPNQGQFIISIPEFSGHVKVDILDAPGRNIYQNKKFQSNRKQANFFNS